MPALNIQRELAARRFTAQKAKIDARIETCNYFLDFWNNPEKASLYHPDIAAARLKVWQREFNKAMNELGHFKYIHNY